jgi:hypothetical protein
MQEAYSIECSGLRKCLSWQILNQVKKVNVRLHYVSHHASASICKHARSYDITNLRLLPSGM